MKNLQKVLRIAYDANINIALWGTHGVGKTQGIQQFAKENDAYLCTLILSQIDPLVLGGYPGREQLEDGTVLETFAKPEWVYDLQQAGAEGKQTILFLDEFNRADRFAHNAAMSLVLDKQINGHELPEDCFIVVAMNPETEGDMGVNELTDPMIDRFAHVPVRADAKAWLNWAEDSEVNQHIVDFIGKAKNKLCAWDLDFKECVQSRIKPTPRSWVSVAKIIDAVTDKDGELDTKRLNGEAALIMSGLIGQAETSSVLTHLKDNFVRPFTYNEILKANKKTVDKVKKLVKQNQVQVLIRSLENFSREGAKKEVTSEQLLKGGFKDFLLACPVDVQAAFWTTEGESGNFWAGIMANMPREVALPLGLEEDE